ncbi:MAG TPA: tetratricopeptide repeat protein [Rhizomicrobium sp.]|nr:tetratricopeptide repeat protein [Rhizomicrobium sp.]
MAQPQPQPSLDALTGADAKLAALEKLESLHEEVHAEFARHTSNELLRRAIQSWRGGDIVRAGQLALESATADPSNPKAYHLLGMALERMGHLHKALVTYERAFQLDPEDPELLINLGLIAWALKQNDGAARMFSLYIDRCPDSPLGYNNLGSILCDMGDPASAIETLRAAIFRLPTEPILWNSLATVLAEEGRAEESLTFYNEAVRLDPHFARLHHNLGYAYAHLGMLDRSLAAYDRALETAVDPAERLETEHSRSICLIGMGRLEEGFREFEKRNNPRFRAYVNHVIKAPQWAGESLAGKRIMVVGEQGLGDEFMFANILPDLARAVGENGKLQIIVDPRLVALFQRSFPQADVGAYDDRTLIDPDGNHALRFIPMIAEKGEPDYWCPMGSALPFLRRRITDFPHEAFLKADPARTEGFRAALRAKSTGPYVGICWRSMMLGAKRAKYYSALAMWEPILKVPGVAFVNLQYGDAAADIAEVKAEFGVDIHVMDVDLKDDIDGAAALSSALDLAISAPTAAAANAGAVGAEVWFLAAGRVWPQLGTDEYPWYRKTRVLSPEKFGDWQELMPRVAAELAAFAKRS